MRRILILLCVCLILSGCTSVTDSVNSRLARAMDITVDGNRSWHYETEEKLQLVLLYLRSLYPLSHTNDVPEDLPGVTITITIHCADGSQRIYTQKRDQYLRIGSGSWQQISPAKGRELWRVLLLTPSD